MYAQTATLDDTGIGHGEPVKADVTPLVDLARAAPFDLGGLAVVPPSSEVFWAGTRETLQPRVMQVLVVLAERCGQVVAHDELIDSCWNGRIVGDDALQRCIGRLRKLAERTGAFTVETIPRIGYRLQAEGRLAPPLANADRRKRQFPGRGTASAVLLIGVALLFATGLWLLSPDDRAPQIDVMAFHAQGGDGATMFARSLQEDVVEVLTRSGVRAAVSARLARASADPPAVFALQGTVYEAGQRLEARMLLVHVESGLALWSARFRGDKTSLDMLSDEVSAAATETMFTVLEPGWSEGIELDPEVLALLVRGERLISSPQQLQEGTPRQAFDEVVARAPGFAAGHALLAMALVNEARSGPPEKRAALLEAARAQADAAIAIRPSASGAAYDAHYLAAAISRPSDRLRAYAILQEGLRMAPQFAFLHMRQCRLLTDLGRIREAIPYCQRALALRPLAGPIGHTNARALHLVGRNERATEAIELSARYNPQQRVTRLTRFEIAAFGDSPDRALALLADDQSKPLGLSNAAVAALEQTLHAMKSGDGPEAGRAVTALQAMAIADQLEINIAVKAMVALGHVDEAFELLNLPQMDRILFTSGASFLFEPMIAPMRTDQRFWDFAAQVGLVGFWVSRDEWPDICASEIPMPQCRSMAMLALANRKTGE